LSLYSVHLLPNFSEPIHQGIDGALVEALANRYAEASIKSLRQNPSAFARTLEAELALNVLERVTRLREPGRQILVAVHDSSGGNGSVYADVEQEIRFLLQDSVQWVGQVTILGPKTWDEYIAPFKTTHPSRPRTEAQLERLAGAFNNASRDETLFYHMTALYVDVDHRRRGLAQKLIHAATDAIERTPVSSVPTTTLSPPRRAVLRIIIKPDNTSVISMYSGVSFQALDYEPVAAALRSGQEPDWSSGLFSSLADAMVAAGDASILPADFAEKEKYTKRSGILMVKAWSW